MSENKFPSEIIDLPSEGRLYPEGHPLKDGKVEIKKGLKSSDKIIFEGINKLKAGIKVRIKWISQNFLLKSQFFVLFYQLLFC